MTDRREFLSNTVVGIGGALLVPSSLFPTTSIVNASGTTADGHASTEIVKRFPYFKSVPVSYLQVTLQDSFWAPRQQILRHVTVAWATRHYDDAGGLDAYKSHPNTYIPKIEEGDLEAIKFVEAMSAVLGLRRDSAIEAVTRAWAQEMIKYQEADGYWSFGWPLARDKANRWRAVWWSHEDYALGHYLESAIGFKESAGDGAMYESAVRAVDNMASTFLGGNRAYAPGHEEIEQALMRLYAMTGNQKYLTLCGWLIAQRGHHVGRRSYGKYSQDHLPIEQQRTIEGHAVRAAFLFNGVTEYVGATGHAGYRETVMAVWNDLVNHKMYLHGGSGTISAKNEGYSSEPDRIHPGDCYGESCAIFANFQWAHSLFRLTGDASYIDVAERMLYNAFYASLSLAGDHSFYHNVDQQDTPTARYSWPPGPCCPPNIVKLFAKVGGFFYSTDATGIFVKHYGQSEARIPFARGVMLTQQSLFPWDGRVVLRVSPTEPTYFLLRLRIPTWSNGYAVSVNGKPHSGPLDRGWITIARRWSGGDTVDLNLPMHIERTTMPARFTEYKDLAALQRGPLVYCMEEHDMAPEMRNSFAAYLPNNLEFTAQFHPELLGGVTVLTGILKLPSYTGDTERSVPTTFIPYGVWNNRTPGAMRIWIPSTKVSVDNRFPADPPGET